jgi:predicted ABC-type transport system involved in lysophospholipase L1 biosynthesis ATPase subunit
MVLQPQLLVTDEPFSNLDASVHGEILRLMLGVVRDTGRCGVPRTEYVAGAPRKPRVDMRSRGRAELASGRAARRFGHRTRALEARGLSPRGPPAALLRATGRRPAAADGSVTLVA